MEQENGEKTTMNGALSSGNVQTKHLTNEDAERGLGAGRNSVDKNKGRPSYYYCSETGTEASDRVDRVGALRWG